VKNPDHLQVPPLTDAAVARIERGVFSALDHAAIERGAREHDRRWLPARWRYAVAMAAAAAAAFTVIGVRELRQGTGLPARGARIATATSPSHLTIPGASLDVAPRSAIHFTTERDGAVVVSLERGAVTCEVAPRSRQAPFVVEAGVTRVTVIGTRFTVERAGDHASVSVEHGTVEVGDDGLTQLVHAGERYRPRGAEVSNGGGVVEPAGATTSAAAVAPSPAPAVAAPAVAAAVVTTPEPPSSGAAAVIPSRALEASDTAPGHQRRTPVAPRMVASVSTGEHRAGRAGGGASVPPPAVPTLPPEERPAAPAPAPVAPSPPPSAPAERPAVPAVPAVPAPDRAPDLRLSHAAPPAERRFQLAAGIEVRDPEGALRIYREIAAGSDAWAANALFAQARLELERGRRDRARALLDAYLQRFPAGPNVTDARALLRKGPWEGPLDPPRASAVGQSPAALTRHQTGADR
jgi:hypothetical protein